MRHSIPILTLVAALLAAAPVQAQACTPLQAGVIVDFAGKSDGYELVRARASIEIAFFFEVRGGDRLQLRRPGLVSIQRADGTIQTVTALGQLYCFEAATNVSWLNNAVRMLGELLTKERNGVGSLITRNEMLMLAPSTLAQRHARVAPGERGFALAWNAGTAPFAVEMNGPDGRQLVAEDKIEARLLRLRLPLGLAPGSYQLRVRDARGALAQGGFTVEAGLLLPAAATPEQAMAAAGALLAQGPERAYDALLVLAPYRRQSESVSELMNLIVNHQ